MTAEIYSIFQRYDGSVAYATLAYQGTYTVPACVYARIVARGRMGATVTVNGSSTYAVGAPFRAVEGDAIVADDSALRLEVTLYADGGQYADGRALDIAAAPGGGSAAATGYLGSVADQAAMLALDAIVGDECLRADVGYRYELVALPATSAGNWQAVQGTIADDTLISLTLVDGKTPRSLLLTNDAVISVSVGGGAATKFPVCLAGSYHEIRINDSPTAAQPTSVTLQRTSGAGATTSYSLEAQ